MQTILVVVHLFLALGLIGLILIQHGKGADAGAAFGSGASATVFGAQGSASFLTRTTAILAALFFVTSMVLAYFAAQSRDNSDMIESLQQPAAEAVESDVPAAPVASDVPVIPAVEPEAVEPEADVPAVEAVVPESAAPAEEAVAPVPQTDVKE